MNILLVNIKDLWDDWTILNKSHKNINPRPNFLYFLPIIDKLKIKINMVTYEKKIKIAFLFK